MAEKEIFSNQAKGTAAQKIENQDKPWRGKTRRRSLRTKVIGAVILLVFFCIGSIGLLSYLSGQAAVTDLTDRLQVEIAARVVSDLSQFLDETANIVRYNVSLKPDMHDLSALHRLFFKQIMAYNEINAIFSGNEALESAGVERLTDGRIVLTCASAETGFAFQTHLADPDGRNCELISAAPAYDPRARPWYRNAVSAGSQTWTDPYLFQPRKSLYIASACPVYGQDDRLDGVVAASLNLNRIGSFLDRLNIGQHGQIFVIERKGLMVAASGGKAVIHEKDGQLTRLKTDESDSPLIIAASREIFERFGGPEGIQKPVQFSFELEGKSRLLHVLPYANKQGIDWLVFIALTKTDFMERITSTTLQTVALGILILAMSAALGVWGAGRITGPILNLSQTIHRLGAGDFSQRTTLIRTDEIGDLFTGFNFMADQLRHSFARIEQAKEELEQRVAERTRELDTQNKHLESEIKERRKVEEVLRESNERNRTILQSAMDGFWMTDMQGRIMEVNETYCRMSGYSAQELLAMHIPDLEATETADDTASHIKKVMSQSEDRFKSQHRRKDGSIFNVEISVQYQPFEGGRFAVFLRDITDRMRNEEALKKIHDELEQRVLERTADLLSANERLSQEMETRRRAEKELLRHQALLSSIIESTSEAIFAKDAAGRYYAINEAGARMLGYRAADVIGRTDMELLPADTAHEFRITDENVMSSGQAYVREETGVIGGKKCIFLAHKSPWRDNSGKIMGVIGVSNDITDRKQSEERLFNSKASLTMVLDGISDPITLLDAQYRVKRMNKAARDYYGLTSYLEAAGKLCFEVRGKSRPCEGCERPFSELGGFSGSYERKGAMDPDKLEQVFVDVVYNESGAPEAYIVRIYDITQAKMMEKQLIQSEKLASLGLLISGIAHEINNPNTFVSFNIPILRDYLRELTSIVDTHTVNHPDLELCGMPYQEFRTDIFKLLDNMEHGSSRINATVSSLKEFSRTRERVEKRLIAMNLVLEKALAICGAEIRKRVKSLEIAIPDHLPPLFTDPEAVEQVLINLLINAVHALDKEDSWIKISVLPDYRHGQLIRCIIEIADNGSGMDEKVRSKIFDPFFTTKSPVLGTGLGLYVCQNLIEKLGGSIEVDSVRGVGSIFRVILPNVIEVNT